MKSQPCGPSSAQEWKWKVESAADTLTRYAEIAKDKKLFDAAKAMLSKRMADLGNVIGSLDAVAMRARSKMKGKP